MSNPFAGVQRYLAEILAQFPLPYNRIAPRHARQGIPGHLWEQFVLPTLIGNGLLWSPSQGGPLSVERQVVTMHDTVPIDCPGTLNPRFARWNQFLLPRLGAKVRCVITDSQFSKSRLIALGIDEQKIAVIPLGVDERFSHASAADAACAATELRLPSRKYVLSLSSLEPRKNLRRLLDAWAKIATRIPRDVWLVLAGSVGKSLVYAPVELGVIPPRVHFTGRVDDAHLPGLYCGAVAFAYVSLYEGFGLPPLEAMAAGTPVLTSDCSSIPEVVGNAAIKVDPENVAAIAEGVLQLVLDPVRQEIQRTAGRDQARQFTWTACAQATGKVLERAASV